MSSSVGFKLSLEKHYDEILLNNKVSVEDGKRCCGS